MKILYDFFPIILFFTAYKIWGIYVATAVIMATGLLQLLLDKLLFKKIDSKHLITSIILIFFGSLTLIFHDPVFIKWKVTIVYWALAIVLLYTQLFSKKTLIETILGDTFALPKKTLATPQHLMGDFLYSDERCELICDVQLQH